MGENLSGFGSILRRVRDGGHFEDSELLPFLTQEPLGERYRVNLNLAEAFYGRHERGADARSLRRARACADRAFLLSRYSAEALPVLLKVCGAMGDAAGAAEALKRAGLEQAARGDFGGALATFDRWSFAYAEFTQIDLHDTFDPEVLACVERMASLHRFDAPPRAPRDGRVRIAYLTQGLTEVNSVLIKIDQVFARHHDRARFEAAYFSVETESAVAASPDARAAVAEFRRAGCEVTPAPDEGLPHERLVALGGRIRDFEPDILVTAGALATFRNYFVACLRPAPLTVSFHQGPSPQFTWHDFDHAISWFRTNVPDCPADCSYVPLEFDFPARGSVEPVRRAELDIPEGATVMLSGGRWQKFQDPGYWRAMVELLEEHPSLYWVLIGPGEEHVPFLAEVLTPAARAKVRFHGWRRDYLGLVAAADLLVDSYPIGGGVFLMEALSLGLPVVTFGHDYVNAFSNNDCSGAEEIIGGGEAVVARGDMGEMKRRVAALVRDAGHRRSLGEACREHVVETRGRPERMVARCEEIYERVLRERGAGGVGASAAPPPARRPRAQSADGAEADEYRRALVEQAGLLDRREAELNRREARLNAGLLPRLRRGLGRVRRKLQKS